MRLSAGMIELAGPQRRFAATLAVAACTLLAPSAAHARNLPALLAEIERVAQAVGGTVGVSVRHIESGQGLYLNRGVTFPMGSLFKVPLAVQVLALVDQGALALDKGLQIQASDLRPGSGKLAKEFREPRTVSVRELLEAMLIDSDNTATDLLWNEAGGAPAVAARLSLLKLKGITVARPTGELLAAAVGLAAQTAGREVTPELMKDLLRQHPRPSRLAEIAAFFRDERDTTSPDGFNELLLRIWRGEALSAAQTRLLLDIMHRCATGRARLPGGLPPGTPVARKTGTLRPHVTNDAGVITLPGRAGHVAVTVLIRESPQDLKTQERTIADIVRAVYGHFAP
jgi:beta-lactamase class A